MSRIFVKNLPKHVAEDRLREFFSQKGEITDAKLMRTKDGKSRQFAFIGYRTGKEAEEAIRYFNKSYLDSSRITCEIAHRVGDPNIPCPWSRYSSEKQEDVTENAAGAEHSSIIDSNAKKNVVESSENDDPQLQEFLQDMQPRARSKMWANDILLDTPVNQDSKVTENVAEKKGRQTSATLDVDRDETNVALDGNETKASDNLARDEVISDMDYFKSRVRKDWSGSESDDDNEKKNDGGDKNGKSNSLSENVMEDQIEEGSPNNPDGKILDTGNQPSGLKDDGDEVLDSGLLFVHNLPYTATEDELTEFFSKFGDISQVHIVIDKDTKLSKGIAYVLYKVPECAVRALEVDKSIFQGRLLHVMPANLKKPTGKQESGNLANQGSKTFKQKREEETKASEASGDIAWNTLFMRPDTTHLDSAQQDPWKALLKSYGWQEGFAIGKRHQFKPDCKVKEFKAVIPAFDAFDGHVCDQYDRVIEFTSGLDLPSADDTNLQPGLNIRKDNSDGSFNGIFGWLEEDIADSEQI